MQSWFYDCIKYLCMRPVHFCLFNWYITNLRSQIRFDIQSAWICEWYSKRNKSHSLTHWGHNCFPLSFRWAPSIRNISARWMNFCRKMNIYVHAFEMFDTCGGRGRAETYILTFRCLYHKIQSNRKKGLNVYETVNSKAFNVIMTFWNTNNKIDFNERFQTLWTEIKW